MPVNFSNFARLHPSGRNLVLRWFDKAWRLNECQDKDSFEPFIYCYISFNSWAACVTGEDTDWKMIRELCDDEHCEYIFRNIMQDIIVLEKLSQFQSLWPIFKAQEIRRSQIPRHHSVIREDVIRHYFEYGIQEYKPKDALNPKLIGYEIPLTWSNTLQTIYRVRCNLFHGDKCMDNDDDQKIVGTAFRAFACIFKSLIDNSLRQYIRQSYYFK